MPLVHWIALFLSSAAVPGTGPDVVWIEVAHVSPLTRDAAMREAAEVLARVGLTHRWRTARPSDTLSGAALAVVLVDEDMAGPRSTDRILGVCDRRQRARVWVYLENVAWTLGLTDVHRPGPRNAARIGRAIGRIVAHEVIHAVAPDLQHARAGLMSARLGRGELLTNRLDVDSATVRAVRRSLAVQHASLTPPRS